MPENPVLPTVLPTVLCIGGLDPSGGAGLAADIRACAAFGALALPVATAIVPQNTRGVKRSDAVSPAVLAAQIETLLEDLQPGAIKIGMLPGIAAIETLAALLRPLQGQIPMVMDTVFAPSSGPIFNDGETIAAFTRELLPLATIVTPNAVEARQLGADEITDLDSMRRAAEVVLKRSGAQSVLLKGGHVADTEFALDLFFDGDEFLELRARRESTYEVRGTGCLLASALAAQLAAGKNEREAAKGAKDWLTRQYLEARVVGQGRRITAI